LHYLLIFSAFGLLMLVLMGPKFQRRQGNIEGQFEGIRAVQHQEQQRNRPGETPDPRFEPSPPAGPDDDPGLIITLKPLMIAAAVVMLLAWAGLQWRRMQRAGRSSLPDGPVGLPCLGEPGSQDEAHSRGQALIELPSATSASGPSRQDRPTGEPDP